MVTSPVCGEAQNERDGDLTSVWRSSDENDSDTDSSPPPAVQLVRKMADRANEMSVPQLTVASLGITYYKSICVVISDIIAPMVEQPHYQHPHNVNLLTKS